MFRSILALLALLAVPAAAQQAAPVPAPQGPRVAITTADGPIVVALDAEHAPISTANFLRYVDAKRFDGITFFRSMKLPWTAGIIQAGQRDPRKLYPPIAHEPTSATGLSHVEGVISMARREPGTAQGDWSITVGDMTGLDAKPGAPGDNAGYAVFGRVVEGMDVVKRIWSAPTDPDAGEGAMKGQMLTPPVRILTVRRVP
ncbi:peptidylprolyl isomerase [Sphingomonas rubra]|uniref:peptidylprolyl isomerase n=1 Tax=Sphingomonas rubra TaxID=634430 RepID=A0A1I5TX34_9SPHN|nr:peptidylprolyl isomerase [Sphingomonas rubra]SFP86876.1 peptidyl-prolyl cis-trans isomerase A (cyclophilin A) [Sphingomonas rubra]